MNPSQHGAIAEAAIAFEALKLGIGVLRPMFEGGRYDLVFDIDGRLIRVQCKVAHRRGDIVNLMARTCRRIGGGYIRGTYTPDEVDVVAAFCPENGRAYLVPMTEIPKSGWFSLRLSPSKNNQR